MKITLLIFLCNVLHYIAQPFWLVYEILYKIIEYVDEMYIEGGDI